MGERFLRRLSACPRRGVRLATLAALVSLASIVTLMPVGAEAADGTSGKIYWGNEVGSGSIRFASLDGSGTAATSSGG